MTDHIYKKIELTGSSTVGMQEAIESISQSIANYPDMRWLKSSETVDT